MAFIETQFPDCISFGSEGGPEFNTTVVPLDSGVEQRLVRWPIGRHRYDAASGVKTESEYASVLAMFHVAQGRGNGFRWKDWIDYKTADTVTHTDGTLIDADNAAALGDGVEDTFYLAKTYTFGSTSIYRPITKPISGAVKIGIDGVLQTETTHYTVDYATGEVVFVSPPGNTLSVTCGCEFDVPVRFDTDYMPVRIQNKGGSFLVDFDIPILEIKP